MAVLSNYFKLKSFVILFWFLQLKWQLSDSTFFEGTISFQDKSLKNNVLESIPSTTGIAECMIRCSNNENCYSINYNLLTKVCELNKATHLSDPDDLYPVPHVLYMVYSLRQYCFCKCHNFNSFSCVPFFPPSCPT